MYESITSRENKRVKLAAELAVSPAARRQQGRFLAEGLRLCMDLAKTLSARTVFFTQEVLDKHPEVQVLAGESFLVMPHVAQKLCSTKTPQGLFCVFDMPVYTLQDLQLAGGVLVCETMQDPANVGAVIRSAAGLGMGGVALCAQCADPFAPKALRASMGAVGRIAAVQCDSVVEVCEDLRQRGVRVYAAALQGAVPVQEVHVQSPFALLIGNEGAGLSSDAILAADERVYLPMHGGTESLNAAGAAGILMYHFRTAQEFGGAL